MIWAIFLNFFGFFKNSCTITALLPEFFQENKCIVLDKMKILSFWRAGFFSHEIKSNNNLCKIPFIPHQNKMMKYLVMIGVLFFVCLLVYVWKTWLLTLRCRTQLINLNVLKRVLINLRHFIVDWTRRYFWLEFYHIQSVKMCQISRFFLSHSRLKLLNDCNRLR